MRFLQTASGEIATRRGEVEEMRRRGPEIVMGNARKGRAAGQSEERRSTQLVVPQAGPILSHPACRLLESSNAQSIMVSDRLRQRK
jgi:hypothetical protein